MDEGMRIVKMLTEYIGRMAALDRVALDIAVDDPEGAAMKKLVQHFVTQDTVTQILQIFRPGASFTYGNIAEIMPKIKGLFHE